MSNTSTSSDNSRLYNMYVEYANLYVLAIFSAQGRQETLDYETTIRAVLQIEKALDKHLVASFLVHPGSYVRKLAQAKYRMLNEFSEEEILKVHNEHKS